MLFRVDPKDPRPIYIQIVDEVRRALVLGTLAPDELLPSVRQLAVTLRINPNTVSQAYRELERQGLAYVRRGQGTFATQPTLGAGERVALAAEVAERAIQDAERNGMSLEELIDAIRRTASRAETES
jgi:GntR family transcriptional regulator